MKKLVMVGNDVEKLIPQRAPIRMVDLAVFCEENSITTGLDIEPDNIFVRNGELQAVGVVEHIAQSAAALAGYDTFRNKTAPKIGYIGEIRKLQIASLPKVGESIATTIKVESVVGSVTLISAACIVENRTIAEGRMKIFIRE